MLYVVRLSACCWARTRTVASVVAFNTITFNSHLQYQQPVTISCYLEDSACWMAEIRSLFFAVSLIMISGLSFGMRWVRRMKMDTLFLRRFQYQRFHIFLSFFMLEFCLQRWDCCRRTTSISVLYIPTKIKLYWTQRFYKETSRLKSNILRMKRK